MTRSPLIDAWHEKARQAVQYRWRQARRAGAHLTRVDVEEHLGLDREQLVGDGLVTAAAGCPSCGRLLNLARVRLTVLDRDSPPRYPTTLGWRTVPCQNCRRPR